MTFFEAVGAPNRTILELKYDSLDFDLNETDAPQSYHTGIEIFLELCLPLQGCHPPIVPYWN